VNAQTLHLDDQATQAATPTGTAVASMPVLNSGSNFQVAPPSDGVNLGTFDIVINPGAGLAGNAPALAAFNRAAVQWENRIADPISVNIDANLAALGPGILGSTNAVILFNNYTSIRNQMVVDAGDEPDDLVTTFLPTAPQFLGTLPAGFGFDGNLQASKANLKALGFAGLDGIFGASDGTITFSTGFAFDFDNTNGVSPGTIDFEAVAAHEIGHLLGFFSEVDFVDFVRSQGQTSNQIQPTTLDMYRFDDAAGNDPSSLLPGAESFTTEPRSLVPGNVEHFDQIDGTFGGDIEVLMSTGLTQGDGRQASHWKDNFGLGLMDPTLAFAETDLVRNNDFRAMDLIGYEILVPEPSSLALLAAGAGLALRRGRRQRH
jgi:hypothetical protein